MNVLFTQRAEKTYNSILEFIAKEWGNAVSLAFEQKTIDFVSILSEFPEMGSLEVEKKGIRGFQLTYNTKVFYRIKENTIIILVFFGTRQSPKKKPK